jgi:hypothetical protein
MGHESHNISFELPDERTAHALAESWLSEYPGPVDHQLLSIVASAVHDGMEIKESMINKSTEDQLPLDGGLAHYVLGFVHGLTDRDPYIPKAGA